MLSEAVPGTVGTLYYFPPSQKNIFSFRILIHIKGIIVSGSESKSNESTTLIDIIVTYLHNLRAMGQR